MKISKTSRIDKNRRKILRYSPPVLRTTGIAPYRIATSCVRPHGSKIDGTRMKSDPAYIYPEKQINIK